MKVVSDEIGFWGNWFLMKMVFDESGFWWKWFLMKVAFWWKWFFDEIGFWWKWFLMKVVFDESGFWWKNFFDESGFDELVLYRFEQIIKEMDQLASEDHIYKATKEEMDVYRGNWWIHTNVAHFDSVPTRYQLELKKGVVDNAPPEASGGREETCNMDTKFLLIFLALACKLVGVRFWVLASKMVWPLIARSNPFLGGSISFLRKESQHAEDSEFLSWINRVQLTAVYRPRPRGV